MVGRPKGGKAGKVEKEVDVTFYVKIVRNPTFIIYRSLLNVNLKKHMRFKIYSKSSYQNKKLFFLSVRFFVRAELTPSGL